MRSFLGIFVVAAVLMSGCGTIKYTPTEYPIDAGVIPAVPLHGSAQIINAQPATGEVIVYSYGGPKLGSDLHSITEAMVRQAEKELAKSARPVAGPNKTIEIKVNSLLSTEAFFHWNSNLSFEARLGNGVVISQTVPHTSGILLQDLNGCIADSVAALLNDQRLRTYLAE